MAFALIAWDCILVCHTGIVLQYLCHSMVSSCYHAWPYLCKSVIMNTGTECFYSVAQNIHGGSCGFLEEFSYIVCLVVGFRLNSFPTTRLAMTLM